MKAYKLTNQNMQTHGGYQWRLNEWNETSGEGELCGPGWLHFYHHPLLAVLLNPIHADIDNPRLFEVEIKGKTLDDKGLKFGATKARLVKEIPLPEITNDQRIAFGILCALEVHDDPDFVQWATNWLNGTDRSTATAMAAESAAWAAWAASAAAWAAGAAAEAASRTAAMAAEAAARADINLFALAEKAVKEY